MEILTQVLRGLLGVAVLIGIAWVLSAERGKIHWRIVLAGLRLQFAVVLVLKAKAIA